MITLHNRFEIFEEAMEARRRLRQLGIDEDRARGSLK